MGWTQWSLSAAWATARGAFGAGGARDRWPSPAHWAEGAAGVRLGLLPRVEFWATARGVATGRGASLADPSVGLRWGLSHSDGPMTSVALSLEVEGAGGREGPATLSASRSEARGRAWSSGTTDVVVGVSARRQLGPLAISWGGGGRYRRPGRVGFASLAGPAGTTVLDPGDVVWTDVGVLAQAGPVAAELTGEFAWHGRSRVRGDAARIVADHGLDSAFAAALCLYPTRAIDLRVEGRWLVTGRSTPWLMNPDLAPMWGPRVGVSVRTLR